MQISKAIFHRTHPSDRSLSKTLCNPGMPTATGHHDRTLGGRWLVLKHTSHQPDQSYRKVAEPWHVRGYQLSWQITGWWVTFQDKLLNAGMLDVFGYHDTVQGGMWPVCIPTWQVTFQGKVQNSVVFGVTGYHGKALDGRWLVHMFTWQATFPDKLQNHSVLGVTGNHKASGGMWLVDIPTWQVAFQDKLQNPGMLGVTGYHDEALGGSCHQYLLFVDKHTLEA